jgi:hypothetical protein
MAIAAAKTTGKYSWRRESSPAAELKFAEVAFDEMNGVVGAAESVGSGSTTIVTASSSCIMGAVSDRMVVRKGISRSCCL